MKKFLIYFGLILLTVFLILYLLDYNYTHVYENSRPRTKFQYFRSLKNKKINYIFLGSSRVENDISARTIEEQTEKKALNLGFQASKLSDIYTILQLIKKYNIQTDKIFIQIDYIFNIENGYSNVMQYELMPFVKENEVTKEYFERHFNDEKVMYYFPFYRYCYFGAKIGIREFILNLANKETKIIRDKGFVALKGISSVHNNTLPTEINSRNKYYDLIIKFVSKNKMPVVFFCAPFCKHTKNLLFIKKLKKKIPNLYDFSSLLSNDNMFQNCSHLNEDGAIYFSKYFIRKMLKSK